MKSIFIALLVCIIIGVLIERKVHAACTEADLNTQISNINALVEDLKDPSKTITENTINTKVS